MKDKNSASDNKVDLPTTTSLKLEPESLKAMDESKVKKFIAPFIVKILEKKVSKIVLLSWDESESTFAAAKVLATALSQQLDKKCAVVIPEGVRFASENTDAYQLIHIPEVNTPAINEKGEIFFKEIDRVFPIQILVGPPLKQWRRLTTDLRFDMTAQADAQILLVPNQGLSREAVNTIEKFAQSNQISWLGIISMDPVQGEEE